jgi:hypothetical protein
VRRYRTLLQTLTLTVVLCAAASAASAVPIGDISRETVSRSMTGGLNHEFGWTASYDIGFAATTGHFDIGLKINLTGADPGDALRTIWEQGIEDTWSRRFSVIHNNQSAHDILVDVTFVEADPHHTVTVHSGAGNVNMLNWYTETSGWPQSRQGLLAAHEAGHMLGNFDEYPGGGVNPNGSFGDVPDGLMGGLLTETLYDRHFQFVADWAVAREPTQTFAVTPTFAVVIPVTDPTNVGPDPITGGDGFGNDMTSLPEPASVILVVSGAAGLASAAWKRRRGRPT